MRLLFLFFLTYTPISFAETLNKPLRAETLKIAIVIDDMGYRPSDIHALSLPGNFSYSFLPHTHFAKRLAVKAHQQNKDVFLHIPMESENARKLGPGALTLDMDEIEFSKSLQASLAEIPFAKGINNHMGSKLTQYYQPMMWTMAFLKSNNLLFLDSKTSPDSQAATAAIDSSVPVTQRDIFLDNHLSDAYITGQFMQLIEQAKRHKSAIGIAHPHPETVEVLTRLIPLLAEHNIELVAISALYPSNDVTQTIAQTTEVVVNEAED